MFAPLVAQIAEKFALPTAGAEAVVRSVLRFLDTAPRGPGAAADALKALGFGNAIEAWAAAEAPALTGAQAAGLAGTAPLDALAHTLHLPRDEAASAFGFALPKVLGRLVDHGTLPAALPAAAKTFLTGATLPHGVPKDYLLRSRLGDWGVRGAVLVAALGILWWLTPRGEIGKPMAGQHTNTPVQPGAAPAAGGHGAAGSGHGAPAGGHGAAPAASTAHGSAPAASGPAASAPASAPAGAAKPVDSAAAPSPAPAAALVPPRLGLKDTDGTLIVEGVVADETTRTAVREALAAVFGADKVKGDVSVNPQAAPARWLPRLSEALALLKIPGLDAAFEGDRLTVNTLPAGHDPAALRSALADMFPGNALALPAALLPPRLGLKNTDGSIQIEGMVADETTRTGVREALAAVFGADKVKGDVSVNPQAAPARWLPRLSEALALLKIPGLDAAFEGDRLTVNALPAGHDPAALRSALADMFPGNALALPAALLPPRLGLKDTDGTLIVEGVVADETARWRLREALAAVFGADKVKGQISLNPQVGTARWLPRLSEALALLKIPGLDAAFEGDRLTVNTLPAGHDPAALRSALADLFPGNALVLPAAATATGTPAGSARLSLREIAGSLVYRGVMPDAASAEQVKAALAGVFGAEALKGDISVDPRAGAPSWLARLADLLAALKGKGVNAVIDGNGLALKAIAPGADRATLEAVAGPLLAGGRIVFPDVTTPRLSAEAARAALEGLAGSYGGADVARTLNLAEISFDTGSADIPAADRALLQRAAALIKALPAGAVVIIEGYTDNVGDAEANLALSQRRADAVKALLIEAGLAEADIEATGYGQANPVGDNATPEGRGQNRRITYEVRPR